jgi:hypothetical protein
VLPKSWLVVTVLLLAAVHVSDAQPGARQDTAANVQSNRSGNWSARTASGFTLNGTWTAVPDSTTGTVIGTWTLVDAQGGTVAGGAWSASKSKTRWSGAWRAVISGRAGEYLGAWTANVDLEPEGGFADLFEKAVETAVSGTWRTGGQSGAWSIRSRPRNK